jgi:tetratricopeptide (TPR) repeat protein
LPTFEQLIQGPAYDWIVLTNEKCFPVEPLIVRPGAIDAINAQVKAALRKPGGLSESEEAKRKRLALYYLPVTLTRGEEREYKLHSRFIREIIYFEDQMLQRVDRLLDEKEVRKAYELLVALEARDPKWPGIPPRRERLVATEAAMLADRGELEQALMLLEELYDKNPAYSGLEFQMGTVVDRLVERALAADDPRQARFFLKRLARRIPGQRVIAQRNSELSARAAELLNQARAAERDRQWDKALDAAEGAARLWPDVPELLVTLYRIGAHFQRLRVGVIDLPGDGSADAVRRPADRRRNQLTRMELFQPDRFDSGMTRYETPIFNSWEPADLGHSVAFEVRRGREDWESRPALTAGGLASLLATRMQTGSPAYEPRFASVDSIVVRSPVELIVNFRTAPLRAEALFRFPLPGDSVTYPFRLERRDESSVVYRRSFEESSTTTDRHVSEIVEIRYSDYDAALQGLLRGEVSMLASVPPVQVRPLSDRSEFFLLAGAFPSVHVLQFNPHSAPLANRALRRALMYSLDRPEILQDAILKGAGTLGRVISAPFPTTSNAYNRLITPHKFDPALAYSLARAAQKELGGEIPPLVLHVPEDPLILDSVRRITSAWAKIGVRTNIVQVAASGTAVADGPWDIVYRTDPMMEPLTDLWPYLTLSGGTDVATLMHLPSWLRQELLALDRAGDWTNAEAILRKLHRQLWAEVHLIPLWEIDQYVAIRKNVRGIPTRPVGQYQYAQRWKIEAWFARD